MDAYVGDGATSGYRTVVEPGSGVARPWIRELRTRKDRAADVPSGKALAKSRRALFKAKDLGNAEENAGFMRRFDHLAALVRIHAHRLLAQHRLACGHRGEDVLVEGEKERERGGGALSARAASRALSESRRDSATTLQFRASAKPGIR